MIICDPETHIYTDTGRIIPGVTNTLEEAGLSDFSKANPDVLRRAQEFGKAVHAACHLHDMCDLDNDNLDPALRPYVDAWFKFRLFAGFAVNSPEQSEQIVYSKIYRYAGTYDRVGMLNNIKTLIDIKSGTTLPKTIALQTAAYMEAYNEYRKREEKIKRRLVVQLLENGTYRMQEYKEKSDFSVFLACLNIVNWKKINNIKGKE